MPAFVSTEGNRQGRKDAKNRFDEENFARVKRSFELRKLRSFTQRDGRDSRDGHDYGEGCDETLN